MLKHLHINSLQKNAETSAYQFSSSNVPHVICFASACHTNTNFDTSQTFGQNGLPQVDAWPRDGTAGIKSLSQKHNDTLPVRVLLELELLVRAAPPL